MQITTVKKLIESEIDGLTAPIKVLCDDNIVRFVKPNTYHSKKGKNFIVFNSELLSYLILKELNISTPKFKLVKIRKNDKLGYRNGIYFGSDEVKDFISLNDCTVEQEKMVVRQNVEEIFDAGIVFTLLGIQDFNKNNIMVDKKTQKLKFFDFSHTAISITDNINRVNQSNEYTHLNYGLFHYVKAQNIAITDEMIEKC